MRRGVRTVALTAARLLIAVLTMAVPTATAAPIPAETPGELSVNFRAAAVDVDAEGPIELSWQTQTGTQTAYQIWVDRAAPGPDEELDVWRGPRTASGQSTAVPYAGPALEPGRRYIWKVRIWDDHGQPSAWSQPAEFGTALHGDWEGAAPIWADDGGDAARRWTDYSLTARVQITRTALGVRFRSPEPNLGYMWQFRADDRLVPHVRDGGWRALDPVPLGVDVQPGTWYDVRIDVVGDTITTWFDGRQVDQRDLDVSADGFVGFRTGRSEAGLADDVTVTSLADGSVLYQNDFEGADAGYPCGEVENGALVVGTSFDCLNVDLSNKWALLRDEIDLPDKDIAWATLYATGSEFDSAKQFVYKAYLDGEFVGLGPTNSWGDEVRFDGFDLTRMLDRGGSHVLSVVGYGERFQAELVVRFTDGSTREFGTGPTWKARTGHDIWTSGESIGTGYYHAPVEDIRMSAYPDGFMRPGFDDSDWAEADVKEPFSKLEPTPFAKVEQQLHEPVRIVDKGDGNYFVDFGRTWIGGVHLTLAGQLGHRVTLRFGEELAAETTVDHTMRTGNTYEDVVTLRDGRQEVNTWGMRVFRYLDVVNSPEPITKENLQALAQVYPFDPAAARLTSSSDNLVSGWQLSKNTIEALNHNFYTDSWTRERTNYEADAYLQQTANAYLSADPTLGTYSMDYFQHNETWPTEWPMYVISAAYDNWQRTGSTDQLARTYDTLVRKLLDERYDEQRRTIVESDAIADWPDSQRDGFRFTEQNTLLNALAYRNYADLAEIADVLVRPDDAATFRATAQAIRKSLNEKFFNEQLGTYDDGLNLQDVPSGHSSVHAAAFPAAFGVPASKDRYDSIARYLAGRGMRCSVYCSGFLLKALYDAGHGQDALNLLTSTEQTSWMNMLRDGAGATGEAWDPSMKPNMTYSHPWAAAPAYVIPRDMYGIRPTAPGFASFDIRPQPGDQRHGSVTVPSVKGNIGVAFSRGGDDRLDLRVDVPGNTVATVYLPVASGREHSTVYVDGGRRQARHADGWLVVDVEPGCHSVSTVAEPAETADVCG